MMRTYNHQLVKQAVDFIRQSTDFEPTSWLANDYNIAFTNDLGDLALFEFESSGVVTGHYYFKSRGKVAVRVAKEFLDELFDPMYNIQVIRGITALEHLGARWLSRQLGFKSHGIVHAQGRAAELFILHRNEYEANLIREEYLK